MAEVRLSTASASLGDVTVTSHLTFLLKYEGLHQSRSLSYNIARLYSIRVAAATHIEYSLSITHRGIWGRSPLLLMSLVEELCVLQELIVWSCLQSDWLPSAAELSRSPLPTPGTLFLSTSSQLLRCSHLNVI